MRPVAALSGPLESGGLTTALTGVAVVLAILWTITNVYTYYPVVRSFVARIVTGTPTDEAAFLGTERLDSPAADEYPDIDVFIPAYEEHEVIHQAIRSVRDTDYPQAQINLTVLLEPDDTDTIDRVESLQTEVDLNLLLVPDEYPGSPNKPRALNYGYEQTDADIVGVIDAENVVAPDLFERVATAFVVEDRDYVQGTVDMANEGDGWKNLLFRAEYGYWYRFIVPAFKRLGFPIPLSGTTCFFDRETLRGVSERRRDRKGSPWSQADTSWLSEHGLSGVTPWDPENVTEDFEVGLSLWLTDEEFGLIDSTTREESPQELGNWLKQRTRWQKGKLYTFLDFFRNPAGSARERGHLLWQSFLPHVGPLNVLGIVCLIAIGTAIGFVPQHGIIAGLLLFTSVFFVAALGSFGLGYWLVSTESGSTKILRLCIVLYTVPFYWGLQWAADIRASKQILLGDLGWEKTVHQNHGRLDILQQSAATGESTASPGAAGDSSVTKAAGGASASSTTGGSSVPATTGSASVPATAGGSSVPATTGAGSNTASTEDASFGRSIRRAMRGHELLLPVLLFAVVLRLPRLGRSLWIDEIYSVTQRGSWGVVGTVTATSDPHPPLYYLALHGWMTVFGTSEVAVRSLSLLFGIGSIVAVYLLGNELYDRRAGLFAALLMAVSSFQIQYAQTARMYTMLVFFATMSTFFFVRLFDNHRYDNRLGYGFMTGGMLLTHIYGSFLLFGQLVYLTAWLAANGTGVHVKQWARTQVISGILFALWFTLIAVPNYLLGNPSETRWLSEPGLNDIQQLGLAYAGAPNNYPMHSLEPHMQYIAVALVTIMGGLLLRQFYSGGRDERHISGTGLLVAVLFGTVATPLVVSHTVFPLFGVRYTIAGFAAVAILAGKAIADIDYRVGRIAVVVVVVCLFLAMLPSYYAESPSEDWERTAASIENDLAEDSLIVFNPFYTQNATEYYLSDQTLSTADRVGVRSSAAPPDRLANTTHEQIWVVTFRETDLDGITSTLTDSYTVAQNGIVEDTDIRLVEFRNTGATATGSGSGNATAAGER